MVSGVTPTAMMVPHLSARYPTRLVELAMVVLLTAMRRMMIMTFFILPLKDLMRCLAPTERSGMRRLSRSLSHPWKGLVINWSRELALVVAAAAAAVLTHLQLAPGLDTAWVLNAPQMVTAMEISSASQRSAPMPNHLPRSFSLVCAAALFTIVFVVMAFVHNPTFDILHTFFCLA